MAYYSSDNVILQFDDINNSETKSYLLCSPENLK